MGVGVELLQVVDRAEAAAEDDLAEAAALLVWQFFDRVEADPLDELGDEDAPARDPGDDFRHVDEGMVAVGAGEDPLVLRLVLVVELLHHPLADLLGDRLRVKAGGDRPGQPHDRPGVAQVGLHRLGDPRVLDLHRDLAAVEQFGPVDLADRGGGERLVVDLGEVLRQRFAVVLLFQHLHHLLPGHRRRLVAQFAELLLVDLAVLLGDEFRVDEGGELADLHRRAFHLPERADHLHRRFHVALLELLLARFLGARHVGRLGARVACALGADDRSELRRTAQPTLGNLRFVGHVRCLGACHNGLFAPILYPLPSDG